MDSQDCGKLNTGICLYPISPGSQGLIDQCDHIFHFDCIHRWSSITNHCPVCRKPFTTLHGVQASNIISSIEIQSREQNSDDSLDEEEACVICNQPSDISQVLYCDNQNCSHCAHLSCLGLSGYPQNFWYCDYCQALQENEPESASSYDEESEEDEEDEISLDDSSDSSVDYEVYSNESDPEADYVPESEEEEQQRPRKVKKTRSQKKKAPKRRKTRQRIRTMTSQERQQIIGSYEDVDHKEMDMVDQAWIIFKRLPQKREREEPKPMGLEMYRQFIENYINQQFDEMIESSFKSSRQKERIKRNLMSKIIDMDKGKFQTDARSLQKIKNRIRSIIDSD